MLSWSDATLFKLYVPLVAWVGLGILFGRTLPKAVPFYLGKFLFWIGVPISIIAFLRQADLSGAVWVAPVMAWLAIAAGIALGWLWIRRHAPQPDPPPTLNPEAIVPPSNQWSRPTQGSFLLTSMVGNTGYLGYPVTLALVGPQYFAWAVFYDTLGSTLGAYGVGIALAARFGLGQHQPSTLVRSVLLNPGLLSFLFGMGFRSVALPTGVELGLRGAAWTVVALSLLLMGMRLSQLSSWRSVRLATVSLSIKMLLVPLILGLTLPLFGVVGAPQLVIVLQMAMPPAFATLVISEAFELDRNLTVTALAMGSAMLLVTLPIWIWLFSP